MARGRKEVVKEEAEEEEAAVRTCKMDFGSLLICSEYID